MDAGNWEHLDGRVTRPPGQDAAVGYRGREAGFRTVHGSSARVGNTGGREGFFLREFEAFATLGSFYLLYLLYM